MYENLESLMARERVSIQDVANLLEVHRNTASSKVRGETEFTIEEAFKLHGRYFNKYSLEWVYQKVLEAQGA